MKRFLGILFLSVVCVLATAQIQEQIVLGRVLSAVDGEPIQAANVWYEGTQIGTTSNQDGYFFLRTPDFHQTLIVSVLGYKRKRIKLTPTDQVITVELTEERNRLAEIVVVPGENEALPIMRRVREAAAVNNPDKKDNFSTTQQQTSHLFLTNVRRRTSKRKLVRELMSGQIATTDSTVLIPLYSLIRSDNVQVSADGEVTVDNLQNDEKTLNLLPENQLMQFLSNYVPNINFYQNNVSVLQTNFISPLARQGDLYYQYFLIDSTVTDSAKTYYIRFRPKNDKELAFKGELWIDSATSALTHIRATMQPNANINYVSAFSVEHELARQADGTFYYTNRQLDLLFSLNLFNKNAQHGVSVVFDQSIHNKPLNISAEIAEKADSIENFSDTISAQESSFRASIDSLNNSKLQRFAQGIVDLVLDNYIHVWKFDLGPMTDWLRYNKLEGFRPTLALRTGESLMEHVTIGGYFGYGVCDKQWKYGGQLQARWGENHSNTLGMFIDNDVIRYGYNTSIMVNENMVGASENLLTTASHMVKNYNLLHINKAEMRYTYEQKGWRFTAAVNGTRWFANEHMQFSKNGASIDDFWSTTAELGLRISFDENSLDRYFHRYYLKTTKPVINFRGEYGYYNIANDGNHYGKLYLTVKQNVPILSGKLKYAIEGGYLFGNVPWVLLETPRVARSFWGQYDFSLLSPMEFMYDGYITANIRYFTSGWLFNYIPYIKKANLRETILFRLAYGGLRDGHSSVFTLPEGVQSLQKMPYMEVGVGICNIFHFLSVESIWRITYRDNPNATKWGIRFRIDLGM